MDDWTDPHLVSAQPFLPEHLVSSPPLYPVFAESQGTGITNVIGGIDDTGPGIRGFLLIPDTLNRADLLSFDGNVSLWDARVMCLRPTIEDMSLYASLSQAPAWRYSFSGSVSPKEVTSPAVCPIRLLTSWTTESGELSCALLREIFEGVLPMGFSAAWREFMSIVYHRLMA